MDSRYLSAMFMAQKYVPKTLNRYGIRN